MLQNLRIVISEDLNTAKEYTNAFFKKNGFFHEKSRTGSRFSKSVKSSIALSPKRVSLELFVRYEEREEQTLVLVEADMSSLTGYISPEDKTYFDGFFQFMEACLQTGVIEKYQLSTLDGEAKNEQKVRMWLLGFLVLTLFPLLFLTDSLNRVSILFVIGIILFLVFNNGRRKKGN